MSYAPEEWAVAQSAATGKWLVLGVPKTADGTQCYAVTWPVPPGLQGLVNGYRERVWEQPEFSGAIDAINQIIDGIRDVGEYKPTDLIDLEAWVATVEGVQAS